jgi:hypothetical protein
MLDGRNVLRSEAGSTHLAGATSVLSQPIADLLGVSDAASAALSELGIRTVFDLGASSVFRAASIVVDLATRSADPPDLGVVPGDLVRQGGSLSLDRVAAEPLGRLAAVPASLASQLATALDIETISDLAGWPPYVVARRLVREAAGPAAEPEDLEAEELRPRFGQFPTERVYYKTLAMFQALGDIGQLTPLDGPVSLMPAVANPGGMTRPAIGALLTFEQSWYAQGVTLGQLLHSLSLAPGEATRIAVIDWSRRTSAYSSETIGESEQLDNVATHARALSEVQQAVANDFQAGGSHASSTSTSESTSDQSADSSGLIASLGQSGSSSWTEQSASTTGEAWSDSWSLGNRSVMGSLTQNVNDRTEQHASSVRSRRATAVREVSQSEHESVSTRIVANYNHMHSLNVQYYEVVQVYRTEVRVHRADRCLFVPLEILDFSGEPGLQVIDRFRGALAAAALTSRIRSLIADDTTAVEIAPVQRLIFPGLRPDLVSGVRMTMMARRVDGPDGDGGTTTTAAPVDPTPQPSRFREWDAVPIARAAKLLDRPLVRPGSTSLFVPDETQLIGVSIDGVSVASVRIDHVGAQGPDDQVFTIPADSGRVDFAPGIRFVELEALHLTKADVAADSGTLTLHCSYLGRVFTLPGIAVNLRQGVAPQKVVDFSTDQADRRRELQAHLQANREYYSRAVFRSLDAATLTVILGGYELDGRPLVEQVEPSPIAVAGNYLVLRAPVDDTERSGVTENGQPIAWNELLLARGLDVAQAFDPRVIPIPTGGVFAEAVLGRSNSAEKLDVTRFWNWQDSPIPLTPPDIAAVATGSRGESEDLRPGQLGQPVVNLVNPTALPEPTSMSAILNALSALNFRDMSGLAGTQGLVSAAELATLDAATAAGRIASDNMRTEAQKAVAMGQIAADVAKSVIAAQVAKAQAKAAGGGGGGVSGISKDGAAINHARKMDEEARTRAASGPASGEDPPSTDAIPAVGRSTDGTDHMPGLENEPVAFRNLVGGGETGVAGTTLDTLLSSTGGVSASTPAVGGDEPARPPFPDAFADPLTWSVDNGLRQKFRDAIKAVGEDPLLATYNSVDPLVPVDQLPIVIVALDGSSKPSFVGSNYSKMYYSGSLLKVAAMYGAFALRKAVADFANGLPDDGLTEAQVIARFRAKHDRGILAGAPNIPPRLRVAPKYADILTVAASGNEYKVNFRDTGDSTRRDFRHHLKGMVEDSHNPSAGVCVQALGYAWINGSLRAAGFARGDGTAGDPVNGIWLAGDYLNGKRNRDAFAAAGDADAIQEVDLGVSGLETVRVPSVNDGPSKQAATCIDLASMFTQLAMNSLVMDPAVSGTDANAEMRNMLANAKPMGNLGRWLTRTPAVTPSYTILGTKIGFGTLGTTGNCNTEDNCVKSEALIIERNAQKFVVVWQNVLDPGKRGDQDYARIHEIIERTIAP